jgi:hypothetical protein
VRGSRAAVGHDDVPGRRQRQAAKLARTDSTRYDDHRTRHPLPPAKAN